MLNSRKFRKITGFWLKMLVWLVILVGVVLVQSGTFRPVEVEASINVSATVNEPIIEKVLPATGPVAGNTGVTITGQNFEGVIAVTFGGVNALSFSVESPTLISAVTPPGKAGAVKVVIVTGDKAVSLDNGFTYLAPPTATAVPSPTTAVSPTNPAPTITAQAAATTAPAATTPATTEIPGTPEVTSPTPAATTPAVSPSPSPEATTPESSPTTTVEPSVTPGMVTTGPTSTPATTAAPSASPTVEKTSTPAVTVTNLSPSPTASRTPVLTPTPVPTSPALNPTATIANTPPAETPATVRISPAATPTATTSISPAETVTATVSVSPAATGTPPITVTVTPGTPATDKTPTATVVVAPTPTAIVAPTATPTASPSPSPSPVVSNPPTISQVSPATGPATGGTAVIITGTNFTEDTQVTFGGLNPASVIINSPTQITVVTAPQPAGKISIVVKTGFGLAVLADGFTYTAQPVEISQEPANFNYSGKLNGKVLTLKSTFSVGVKDLSGSGLGWRLVARSTVLSSGNDIIPVANHTIQNVRVVTKSGAPPQNRVTYPLIFPTSDSTIFSAEPNTGTGESIITFETQLIIPPDIPAGNYKLTLNVAVEPGS